MRPNGKIICFALLFYHGFGEWYIEKIAKLEVLFVDKNELAKILSALKQKATELKNVPGFISFDCYGYGNESNLHLSYRAFSEIYSPEDVSIKNFSWDEKIGFKYQAFIFVDGIKVHCIMTEDEREKFLRTDRLIKLQPNCPARPYVV